MNSTKTKPRAEVRLCADFPAEHFDLLDSTAREGERTNPSQLRLIVREWFARQQEESAADTNHAAAKIA